MRPDGPFVVRVWDDDFDRWNLHSDHDRFTESAAAFRTAALAHDHVALLLVAGGAVRVLSTNSRRLLDAEVFRWGGPVGATAV